MRLIKADDEFTEANADGAKAVVELARDELCTLNNALNEILHGAEAIDHDDEFHTRIGATRNEAERLLDQLHQLLG